MAKQLPHRYRCALVFSLYLATAAGVTAAPPPPLPGEEITDEYLEGILPRDTIKERTPPTSPTSALWLDKATKSWEAPDLSAQLGADQAFIPIGKGAVFIPRMSGASLEPDVEMIDSLGHVVDRGKPGRTFSALPGTYSVVFGSGSHQQLIVRNVTIQEGKVKPLIPDWSGLIVDVVNENNMPISGDYELVRIDEFQPYGRGRGADPDLGEETPTWILRPGIYKLLSVGESYNSLSDFITVRLLAGHLTRVMLIMDEESMRIRGGGIVEFGPERVRTRTWSYGFDIGGSLLFNATVDRRLSGDNRATNSSTIALLLNGWLRYNEGPRDWTSSLRLDEGFSITDFDFAHISSTVDNARLRSLFIWRLLSWLGPYARLDLQTSFFAKHARRDAGEEYFVIFDKDYQNMSTDSTTSLQIEAPFSPLSLRAGIGANMDIIRTRVVESRFRLGFGYSFTSVRERLTSVEDANIPDTLLNDTLLGPHIEQGYVVRDLGSAATHEAGPEASLVFNLSLGKWVLSRSEVAMFMPVAPELRLTRPDLELETTLSWRIARSITLDYELQYTLKQPAQENLRQDEVRHGVRLRYSRRTR